jgi:hypothetical protein
MHRIPSLDGVRVFAILLVIWGLGGGTVSVADCGGVCQLGAQYLLCAHRISDHDAADSGVGEDFDDQSEAILYA